MASLSSFLHLSGVILLGSAVLTACDTPGLTFVDPDTGAAGPEDTPDAVHVQLEDSALAAALGWTQGVPNAEVQVHRFIDPFRPDTLYTDSVGHALLPNDLLAGDYRVAALRVLTADEAAATGGTIRAFGDGFAHRLPADTVKLRLGVDQPGSLVFSEIYHGGGTQDISYRWDQFVELYNNADTTVYLDGVLYGSAYGHIGSGDPCEESRAWREDPLGLWRWSSTSSRVAERITPWHRVRPSRLRWTRPTTRWYTRCYRISHRQTSNWRVRRIQTIPPYPTCGRLVRFRI